MEFKEIERYRPLIYGQALAVHLETGVSFEELYSEALEIAVKAVLSFDPSKGASYFTWLNIQLKARLYEYGKQERLAAGEEQIASKNREKNDTDDMLESITSEDYIENLPFTDKQFELAEFYDYLKNNLSEKSLTLVGFVFSASTKFRRKVKKYERKKWDEHLTKEMVKNYLTDKGWRKKDIKKSFAEIKNILTEWRNKEYECRI